MLERYGGESIPSEEDVRDEMARDDEMDRRDRQVYYCAICDVELLAKELIENCCPYCQTEIPDAVEKEADIPERM